MKNYTVERFEWAWGHVRNGGLNTTASLVLLALTRRADRQGICWPSRATIAADCSLGSLDAVDRALGRIEALGLVTRQRRSTPRGRTSNRYLLHLQQVPTPQECGVAQDRNNAATPAAQMRHREINQKNPPSGCTEFGEVVARAYDTYVELAEAGILARAKLTPRLAAALERLLLNEGGGDAERGHERWAAALRAVSHDDFLAGRIHDPGKRRFRLTLRLILDPPRAMGDVFGRLIDLHHRHASGNVVPLHRLPDHNYVAQKRVGLA